MYSQKSISIIFCKFERSNRITITKRVTDNNLIFTKASFSPVIVNEVMS
jgi:hypothetical protein